MRRLLKLLPVLLTCATAAPALAAQCEPPGGFGVWLEAMQRDAAAAGISQGTISATLAGLTPDPKVLALDRNQKHFKQSFEQFAANRITPGRLSKGAAQLRQRADLFARIERQFGVPGPVLVAIWGMETDFGTVMGKQSAIRSLATLAHDCRRTEMFQGQLLDALRIVERGDMVPAAMRGAWAGELGQTQFLPTSYVRFAVDFDGDGRRDLINSVPDVLASTANYLKGYGWRPGQPWTEGTANFAVLQHWNKAQVYQKAIALFATKLASGA
jgi:lytic murein transglycosylase